MKKVLLVGIYGVYNYGCEAIVRGSVEILKKKYNNEVEIYYATPSIKDDQLRLVDCDIKLIERKSNSYTINNVIRKLLDKIDIEYPALIDYIDNIEQFSSVYSIGGDIYTLDKDGKAPLCYMNFANKCIEKNIPYYMLCSSIGPFKNGRVLDTYIKPHLRKINKIYAREQGTIDYLKSIGIVDNVCYLTDPAFFVPSIKKDVSLVNTRKKIGVNLSPLSALHLYSNYNVAVEQQTKIISNLILNNDVDVLLIPHVKSEDINDDDFRYLSDVYSKLPQSCKDNVELLSDDIGFLGRKSQIVSCDYMIAARMHCAINAICCNVPTIFLSYSQKAIGMSEIVYKTKKYVVSLADFESIDLIDLFESIEDFSESIKDLVNVSWNGDSPSIGLNVDTFKAKL